MIRNLQKKKHILLITPFAPPSIGGAETHLEDLYEYLRKDGYFVSLLTYQPLVSNIRGPSKEERSNLIIYRYRWFGHNLFTTFEKFPPVFNFLYITPYLLLISIIFMLFHQEEIDVVHVFGLNAAFIGRILKLLFRKKTIMSFEALYGFDKKTLFSKICYWVLKDFDKILVGSLDSKKDVLNLGLPEEKVVVYTHWINLDRFKPDNKKNLKRELGWEDKFTVLYAGRLIPQKGVKIILEIAQKTLKNINFKIIGDEGPELKRVKRAAERLANLEYVGRVPYQQMHHFFAAADIFVYPALYEEDLARVLLESMACGTPVINTNKGSGIYELNSKVAFITKPDVKEIQDKIEFLYDNPDKLTNMTRECFSFAKKFGPTKCAKIITDSYKEIANKDNPDIKKAA